MEDSGKVALGLLAGVAIGATLGILFAPDKGEETRKKISARTMDLEDELEDRFNDFMDDMKQKFATLKDEAEDAANEEKSKVEKAKQSYNTAQ